MAAFTLITPQETEHQAYKTDLPAYAYIRFSTMGQVKNSRQSKYQQDTRMHEKLVRIGFTDIRKKDKDEGISAQKGTSDRLDLGDIYTAMRNGQCGAVAAYDASRLWRDRQHVFYHDFVNKLIEYDVPFISYERTYWPKIKGDMDALRDAFKKAQADLDQMYGKANPARREAVLRGGYGGHSVPMGYVVVDDDETKKYVIYEPHAVIIRWIFRRYKQLNGNLGRLGRELVAADFHFPDFDRDMLRQMDASIPHVSLQHDEKGYRFQSRNGLLSVLTNRAYLGWYCYEARSKESGVFVGEFVNKEAHTGIVGYDDFLYAYTRLSATTLDGEANEEKPAVDRHYSKVDALLEGLLTSNGLKVYAMREGYYEAVSSNDGWNVATLNVSIKHIDDIFVRAMIDMLRRLELKQVDASLAEKVKALIAERAESAANLENEIALIEKATRQWEVAKQAAMVAESVNDTAEAIRNLKRLNADRDKLLAKVQQAGSETSQLEESGDLLERATQEWHSWTFEKQRRLVKLIVCSANIEEVSSHFLQLSVCFSEPVMGCDFVCYTYRARGSKPAWTPQEDAVMRRYYAQADRAVILEKLPNRSWDGIMQHAMDDLHINRSTRLNTSGIPTHFTYADAELLRGLELGNVPAEMGGLFNAIQDLHDNAYWVPADLVNAKHADDKHLISMDSSRVHGTMQAYQMGQALMDTGAAGARKTFRFRPH